MITTMPKMAGLPRRPAPNSDVTHPALRHPSRCYFYFVYIVDRDTRYALVINTGLRRVCYHTSSSSTQQHSHLLHLHPSTLHTHFCYRASSSPTHTLPQHTQLQHFPQTLTTQSTCPISVRLLPLLSHQSNFLLTP